MFAKELARVICGAEDHLVFLEMGQFTGPSAVCMLVGAPAGYIGYGEGRLVNAIRDSPERCSSLTKSRRQTDVSLICCCVSLTKALLAMPLVNP